MIQTDTTHTHTYDEQGRRTCCTQEDRIYSKADEPEASNTVKKKTGHSHEHRRQGIRTNIVLERATN